MRHLLSVLLAGLAAGCGASWPAFDRDSLPEGEWGGADRVVLLDDVTVRFTAVADEPVAEVTERRRIWYRTPRGIEDVQVGVGYQAGLRDLVDFRGRVIAPDGEESTFDRGDALDLPAFGGITLFSDSRYLAHRPQLSPGAVVETVSTVRYRDMRLWSPRQVFAGWHPLVEGRLTVHLPPGWDVRHLAREAGRDIEWAPALEAAPTGARTLVWRREGTPALVRERHAPAPFQMAPMVAVQLTRWIIGGQTTDGPAEPAAISARLHAMQAPRLVPDDAIRARVDAILADVEADPAARAARLYAHVRDRVRYVSVQLGMGGWIPHASQEVLDVGFGDCKDQASLLGTMLAVAGIPSRQVTVWAHGGWPWPYGLPTIAGNANHQVVFVDLPDRSVLADPTHTGTAFGEVPFALQGADVLPLSADGDPVERVPVDPPEANRLEVTLRLAVGADGWAKGAIDVSAVGAKAHPLRHHLLNERGKERRKKFDDRLGVHDIIVNAIERTAGVVPTTAGVPLEARVAVRRDERFGPAGQVWSLTPDTFFSPGVRRIEAGPRTRPILLGVPRVRHHRVALALPPERRPGELPAPVEIEAPFATYRLVWRQAEGGVELDRQLTWTQPWIGADQVEAYRAFADAILRADARAVVLRPVTPGVPESPAEPPPAAPRSPTPKAPVGRPTARLEGDR